MEPTKRELLETELMKKQASISPITTDDYLLFRQFGNGYKNTLTYNAQAVNGWNPKGESRNRLGLRYYDGKNLLTFGYFKKNGTDHFHLIPYEAEPEKIHEIAELLYQVSNSPVYIKKVSKEQKDSLLAFQGFFEVDESNGLYKNAPLEDDTYPELVIDLEATLKELEKSRSESQVKDKYVRAVKRYVEPSRLIAENYDPTSEQNRKDALGIVQKFFEIQEEKKNILSYPEDYFNIINLKPVGIDYFSSIFYVDKKPAGFYFAEGTEDTIHVYANLALYKEFKYLPGFILIHLFQEAFNQSKEKGNLGGSETKGLDAFKRTFKPVEENQMHWLLFNPTDFGK